MSPNNNSFIASKPPTHRQQRHPVAPQSGPILLPNLSPRPTLDEDQLGSPEFRDALQAAKQSRSNGGPSNHLLRSPLSSDPLPCHSSTTLLHDFEGDYDYTRRMQTCVAIRDNLKSPHHFQIMSLHEVKKLRGPVQPMPPAIPSRKLSTTRENRKTLLAPQSHEYTASYTTTSMHSAETIDVSGSAHLDDLSPPLQSRLTTKHSENYINDLNKQDPHVAEMSGLGIAAAPPRYNQPPPRLSHRGRALSLLSNLGSSQNLASSRSLQDIQIRAASSTKNRRKIPTLSNPSTSPVVSVRPRKSLSSPKTSDSHTIEPSECFVKRRAIYTGSMYLDSPATSDATFRDENQNVYPQVSVHSVFSQTENMHQSTRSPHGRPSKVHLGKDVPGRRAPLVFVDVNVQTKCKSSAIHHTSMPPSAFFVSRSSSFLSTDPFASATVDRRWGSESPERIYHPIVLDLLTALDLAIGEWSSV